MAREIRLGTAVLGFRADVRQYLKGLTSAEKAIRAQQRAVYRMRRSFYQLQRQLSRTATSMTSLRAVVISLFGGGLVVRTVADFEQGMATVAAISGTTGRQLEALRAKALQLGATMPLTATQAAEGMQLLARAGFSAREVFDAIPGTLNLAIIGQLELGRASDIASNILTGFSIAASEQNRVTDVLAKTTTRANTNIQQLGDAMKFVAPIAQTVGVTLEETSAALGLLGDAGLQGTIGGTGFRRFLLSLEAPTKLAIQQLNSIGLSIEDVRVSTVGLEESLRKLAPLATSANLGKAFNVFGARGTPAFVILARFQEQLFEFNEQLLQSEGYADEVAAVMKNNLSGAFKEVRSALEGLAIAVGDLGITDALTSRLQTAANVIRAIIAGIRDTTHDIFPDIAEDSAFAFRYVIANLNILRNAFILLGFVILRHTNLGKFIINTIVAAARTFSLAAAVQRTRDNYRALGQVLPALGARIRTAFAGVNRVLTAADDRIIQMTRGIGNFFVSSSRRLGDFARRWTATWSSLRRTTASATQGLSLNLLPGAASGTAQAFTGFFSQITAQLNRFRATWNASWVSMRQAVVSALSGLSFGNILQSISLGFQSFYAQAIQGARNLRVSMVTTWQSMRVAALAFFNSSINFLSHFRGVWNTSWQAMVTTFHSAMGIMGNAFRATIATMLSLLQILKVSIAAVATVITRIVWPLAIIEGIFFTITFLKDLLNTFNQLDVSLGDVITVTIGELVKFVVDSLGKIPVFLARIVSAICWFGSGSGHDIHISV